MRSPAIILVWGCLLLPLRSQVVEIVLPDTVLRVPSIQEVIPVLTDRLVNEGCRGRLGSVYRLERAVLGEESEVRLNLNFLKRLRLK